MILKTIFVVIILFFTPLIIEVFTQNAFADIGDCTDYDGLVTYKIGIVIVDIGDIDLITGTYNITYWIFITSDDVDLTKHPLHVDFVNGKDVDVIFKKIEPDLHQLKINGDFFNDMDFRNHPFTTIDLKISIESADCDTDFIQFAIDDELNYLDSDLYIPGYVLKDVNVKVEDHDYPGIGDYARYTLSTIIVTPFVSSFLQSILPILVLLLLSILMYRLPPEYYIEKVEVASGLLIGAIFFHSLSIMASLPALDYLTLQDKLMGIVYLVIFYSIFETVVQRKFDSKEQTKKEQKMAKLIRFSFPIVIAAILLVLWTLE